MKEIIIDGVAYTPKSESVIKDGLEYVIVRTDSAGVHAGFLSSRTGKEVELLQARRIYYWEGACSLSEMAMKGVAYPEKCKFPCAVNSIILTEAIEIIRCTQQAYESIIGVPEWKTK